MSTWIKPDERMRVVEISAEEEEGFYWVDETLTEPILTYDGIPLYAWDGDANVQKRNDQAIARDRREKKKSG